MFRKFFWKLKHEKTFSFKLHLVSAQTIQMVVRHSFLCPYCECSRCYCKNLHTQNDSKWSKRWKHFEPFFLQSYLLFGLFRIFFQLCWRMHNFAQSRFVPFMYADAMDKIFSYTINHSYKFFQENMCQGGALSSVRWRASQTVSIA